jgi:hypothetical protein
VFKAFAYAPSELMRFLDSEGGAGVYETSHDCPFHPTTASRPGLPGPAGTHTARSNRPAECADRRTLRSRRRQRRQRIQDRARRPPHRQRGGQRPGLRGPSLQGEVLVVVQEKGEPSLRGEVLVVVQEKGEPSLPGEVLVVVQERGEPPSCSESGMDDTGPAEGTRRLSPPRTRDENEDELGWGVSGTRRSLRKRDPSA